jgi:hypothetical protein
MLINVTQEHINNGIPTKCGLCPVALAINDVLNNTYYHAYVYHNEIDIANNSFAVKQSFDLPESVKLFINKFDKNLPVEPFKFELDIDPKYIKE